MSAFNPSTHSRMWIGLLLVLLAVVPRFVLLDAKPLHHDESMFAFYAWEALQKEHYTHMPILHGPVQMLGIGWFFKHFGDSIASARAFIALCSLVMLATSFWLFPRRWRWWMMPLLITSPILLYYSRYLHEELIFSASLLLGTLGFARGVTRRGRGFWWGLLGPAGFCFLLAIKENALFVYAAGVTFIAAWGLTRLIWPRADFSLRPSPRPRAGVARSDSPAPQGGPKDRREARRAAAGPQPKGKRQRRGATYQNPSFNAVIGEEPHPHESTPAVIHDKVPAPAPPAPPRDRGPIVLIGWLLGMAIGVGLVLLVYGSTTPDKTGFKPLYNMKASWDYWLGQHKQHRIEGPIHYYLPILLTYELPILLALVIGLKWDALQRLKRALFYGYFMVGWLVLWQLWRIVPHEGPLLSLMKFLHVEPNASMLILGWLIAPILAWSILMLREHKALAAWMGWWAACSLFQYSSAGEKVPWLAANVILPIYMMLGWLWAPRLRRLGPRGRALALAAVLLATLIAARNDYYLVGPRAADPRERIVYNHTPPEFDRLCRKMLERWASLSDRIPLERRRVILAGDPGWPGVWYFRHCNYVLQSSPQAALDANIDLVIARPDLVQNVLRDMDSTQWNSVQLSLRSHWLVDWPKTRRLARWWNYYWFRENWPPEPGGFPVVAIEPMLTRQ